jgi:hypothetical protein
MAHGVKGKIKKIIAVRFYFKKIDKKTEFCTKLGYFENEISHSGK